MEETIELLKKATLNIEELLRTYGRFEAKVQQLKKVSELSRQAVRWEILSPREREILRMIRGRIRPTEIAARLGISKRTVEAHRDNIRRKFKLKSAVDLEDLTAH